MNQYEYKVIDLAPILHVTSPEKFEKTLNELGSEGWELVALYKSGSGAVLFLKREKTLE